MTDATLIKECEATTAAAQQALDWIADPKN